MGWYIEKGGEAAGPFKTDEAIDQLRRLGEPETLVWRDGLEGWEAAASQPEFGGLFPKRPPPLPDRGKSAPSPLLPSVLPPTANPHRESDATAEPFELAPAVAIVPGSPWSRYFARQIDLACLGFGGMAALGVFLLTYYPQAYRGLISSNPALQTLLSVALAIFLNIFVISIFGNSFGKKVFGLVAVPDDITRHASPIWVAFREFRVWVYGLAFGIPIFAIFTMGMNHKEVKAGLPARYDRHRAVVLERPIGRFRRAFGMVLSGALIVSLLALNAWDRAEAGRVARVKPWVNPVTLETAQIPAGWSIDAANSNPAEQLFAFASVDGMEAVFIGAEDLGPSTQHGFDLQQYGLALEKNIGGDMTFRGRWTETRLNNRMTLIREAVTVTEGWPAAYAIWQDGATFWRVVAVSSIPGSPPRLPDMPIVSALTGSAPTQ